MLILIIMAGIFSVTMFKVDAAKVTKIEKSYDYVVEAIIPSASNGYSWRRVFKSGWVEMGGQISSSTATNATVQITFPFTLQAGYFASSNTTYTGSDAPTYGAVVKAKDLTSITVGHMTGHTTNWFVSGIIM